MRRNFRYLGSATMAAVLIGGGTLVLSGGSSLVSGSVPTTSVASNSTPKPHPVFMFKGPERAVYSESVVPVKSGGYETIIMVKGSLSAISSTSVSVKRPDTGAIVTASVASSTKFIRTTEAALASDLSSGKVVTVMLVEVRGTARLVAVPPSPGSRPVSHGTPLAGHVAPPASSNTNSSGTAGTTA